MSLNRIVAVASGVLSLGLAVLPVIADMDWRSTAGIIAGIIAVLKLTDRWLEGWSRYETAEVHERTAALHALATGQEIAGATQGVKAEGFEPPEASDG
jgi:hypothetical protein